VWVARKPPGFAFIDFDDKRDAEDALRDIDGNTTISLSVSLFESRTGHYFTHVSNFITNFSSAKHVEQAFNGELRIQLLSFLVHIHPSQYSLRM
jgi:hypothetical protein